VTPVKHLQLPGGCSPPLVPDVTKLPWSTPTLTEISFADLPTELRALALGLPVPEPNGWKVVLEGGAAPSVQPEIEPWPTVVNDGKGAGLPFGAPARRGFRRIRHGGQHRADDENKVSVLKLYISRINAMTMMTDEKNTPPMAGSNSLVDLAARINTEHQAVA